jgi:hypothetical protein
MRKFINGFVVIIFLFSLSVFPASASQQVEEGVVFTLEDVKQFGSELGLTEEEIIEEYNNYLIIKDYFKLNEDGSLYFDTEEAKSNRIEKELLEYNDYMVNEQMASMAYECKGQGGKWSDVLYKKEAWFDNCQTNEFVRLLQLGAAMSLMIAAANAFLGNAPAAFVSTMVGIIMGYTAFELSNVDRGCGIKVTKPIGVGSISGQTCN